ncbi:hypothetical protein AOQ84DRAFT_307164, partial [Glonium stellatum]
QTVTLWDVVTGAALQTFEDYSSGIHTIALSPNGKQLASVSWDTTIKLWEAATGVELQTTERGSPDIASLPPRPDQGLYDIESPSASSAPPGPNLFPGLFVRERWVVLGMKNILWLPAEYEKARLAVRGNVVALGLASDHVIFIEFAA